MCGQVFNRATMPSLARRPSEESAWRRLVGSHYDPGMPSVGTERGSPAPADEERRGPLVAVLVFAMIFPAVATWFWFVAFAGHPLMKLVYGSAKVLQFLLPALWVMGVARRGRPERFARIRGRESGKGTDDAHTDRQDWPRGRGIVAGLGFGSLVGVFILAVYFGFLKSSPLLAGAPAAVHAKVEQLGLATIPGYLALALFYSVLHSLLEEYYWRWFVFGSSRRLISTPAAIVLSSLAFTAHHVIVVGAYLHGAWLMTVLFSVAVAGGGAVWAWLYERTGSLYGPWLSHLLVDAAIMTVGYDMIFA